MHRGSLRVWHRLMLLCFFPYSITSSALFPHRCTSIQIITLIVIAESTTPIVRDLRATALLLNNHIRALTVVRRTRPKNIAQCNHNVLFQKFWMLDQFVHARKAIVMATTMTIVTVTSFLREGLIRPLLCLCELFGCSPCTGGCMLSSPFTPYICWH